MTSSRLRSFLSSVPPEYLPIAAGYSVLDKEMGVKQYVAYMLDRTNTMFEWSGLPETIPAYMLELYLQIFGYAAFVDVKENRINNSVNGVVTKPGVHIFFGGIGGERDIYYRPKLFTAGNPRLKVSVQSTILYPGDDTDVDNPCVLMAGDRNYMGLLPLFNRYAQQLVENDISIRSAQINARAQVGIVADTDRQKETARKYLDDLESGKLGIIGEGAFMEGISIANVSTQSSNVIIQLIELQQYLKASWFNDLGLNVNFNMKREYMSEEEIAVNTDILLPLVDDMLKCRQEAAELLNTVFDLNVSVEKSSAWANKQQEELSALAEAANSAGIELDDSVQEQIDVDGGDGGGAEVQEEVQQDIPSTESEQQSGAGNETESGDVSGESSSGAEQSEADAAYVNGEPTVVEVNITVNTEGGDANVESETPEESGESDSESDDA